MKRHIPETSTRFRPLLKSLSVVVLMLTFATAAAAQDCVTTLDPVEQEVKPLLARINADPFSGGFTTIIDKLAQADGAIEAWLRRAEVHSKTVCEPYFSALRAYEGEAQAYQSRCPSVVYDVALYNQCRSEYDRLKPRQAALEKQLADLKSAEAALNADGAKVLELARAAVEPAREILDERNTEKAFSLLAQSKKQDVSHGKITDCQAMAQLFDALSAKVGSSPDEVALYAGKVLANGVGFRGITVVARGEHHVVFGQSGFRAQYQDDDPSSRNQVRHFVGYLVLGLKYSTGTNYYADAVAEWRDAGQSADISLGVVGANLGKSMADQPRLLRGLGGAIRTTICQ